MHNFDTNFWGLMAMPVGLLACFSPALIIWLKQELSSDSSDKKKNDK